MQTMQERSNWVKNCEKLNKCKIREKVIFFQTQLGIYVKWKTPLHKYRRLILGSDEI